MVGLVGKKLGMTQVFDQAGVLTPATVIGVPVNVIVAHKLPERDGYSAVVLGAIEEKEARASRPHKGCFPEGVAVRRKLVEVRDFDRECKPGDQFDAGLIQGLSYVDVTSVTKGKGFQGAMKRHGFSGGSKTHGSKFHRAHGSTGAAAHPARVMKGRKMAGRMGAVQQTTQNLKVLSVDMEKSVVLVKGAVPGRRGCIVVLKRAKKK